jgi:hypothetical protein
MFEVFIMANGDEGPVNDSRTTADPSPGPSSSDIEEGRAAYRPSGFHPAYIGDVFHDKYEVLSKIGYGVYSTIWLSRVLSTRTSEPIPAFYFPVHESAS